MKSLQAAMFPLLFVLWLCGLGVFEYPWGRSRLHLSILYVLVMWVLYIYIILWIDMFIKEFAVFLPKVFKINMTFAAIYMLLNLYYYKVRCISIDLQSRVK